MTYLNDYLEHLVQTGVIPGASYSLVRKDHIEKGFLGFSQLEPEKREVKGDTIYDLASLTKVVATSSLVLKALEDGCLTLDMHLKDLIVDFPYEDVTIEDLLCHRAGYPASIANRSQFKGREAIIQAAMNQERLYPAGERIQYSDISFIILGHVLELRYQKRLDLLFDEKFLIPMGMQSTFFNPPKGENYAATEKRSGRPDDFPMVHDGTAYAMQGVAGHAGLFSNIDDLSVFVQMLLNDGQHEDRQILSPRSIALLRELYHDDGARRRTLAWQVNKGRRYCDLASERALYHTGFTGTSILIDDDQALILLTNAIHPDGDKELFVKVRKQIHNIAMAK